MNVSRWGVSKCSVFWRVHMSLWVYSDCVHLKEIVGKPKTGMRTPNWGGVKFSISKHCMFVRMWAY